MKIAALQEECRGGSQKACQDLAKMGQPPRQGQQPQQAGRQPRPGRPQLAGQAQDDGGAFKPPAGTKIEETVAAPVQERAKFEISPHGVHIATIENEGSRAVVWYDGTEGPKFDEIFSQIVFSQDGNRYAYCARSGNQFVVMVDGKELVRSSESQSSGRLDENSCLLGFTSNSKHVFFLSSSHIDNPDRNLTRFVFDGKPELPSAPNSDFRTIAFSPDGNHYGYVWKDPIGQKPYMLIVDGKPASYQAGAPQWTSDSKHLYTQRSFSGGSELLYDGKPITRAFNFQIHIAPTGDMVVMAVTGGTNGHPFSFLVVNGKKVPGSDTVERGLINEVVFSPDGKHYAAHCQDLNNHHYVITDGKRRQEYTAISNLSFTADSSAVVYQTIANGKMFLVVGDREYGGAGIGDMTPVVIAPAGNRVGALIVESGRPSILMDGKVTPLNGRGVSNLSFTPDGAHYSYLLNVNGSDSELVIDGVPQPGSNVSKDRASTRDSAMRYVISADSKHFAHFATSETASGPARGVNLDGKFFVTAANNDMELFFSPDSKHLLWVHQYPAKNALRLFVDGKPLVDFTSPVTLGVAPNWWDFNPDGTLSLLSQDGTSLKRITVSLSSETSVDSMTGKSTGSIQARQ